MHRQAVLLAFASFFMLFVHAAETPIATDMGPAAFLWPPDRVWGAAQDNTPPCGSSAGVINRTEFPLTHGQVSLVLQDESYNTNLAISYDNNPTENKDFTTLVSAENFPDLNPGHECYDVPNPPKNINPGANATLQISYLSTFDTDKNQTFYACADITYVELSAFKGNVFCRNISATETQTSTSGSTTSSTGTASASTSTSNSSSSSSSKGSGLSGGQIAGIVIGSLAGAALVAGGLFLLWSRHQRQLQRDKIVAVRMSDWGSQPAKPTSGQS